MQTSVLTYLEESVKKYPKKVAFLDEKKEITFLELKQRALDIAYFIIEKYGKRRTPVLVYLPKEVDSIVSFMGILYSGNFYTPTDIRFPAEKLNSIVSTLHPQIVIVNNETESKWKNFEFDNGIMILNIDNVPVCNHYNHSAELLEKILDSDPVYTFFTSGSTGAPKGVVITNHNIIDYIDWATPTFNINEETIMGNQSPFYFDISTQDIYSTLKAGATLAIIPIKSFAFPVLVLNYIVEKHINFLYWVPSAFVNIANYKLLEKVSLNEVHTIMFGGEVMPVKQLNYWKKYLPNLTTIANVYGPTEATVNCTYYIVDRDFDDGEVLPLGKACENTGLIVLDEDDNVISQEQIDTLGELCVYGSSLSPGYFEDEEKTAEKFTYNPLMPFYKERMYRTGDLVYYNSIGELVFAGRKDHQIKHMGYRIELGEIESAAMRIEGIKNVCADYDTQKKFIILYYTKESDDLTDDLLIRQLSQLVPQYMIPSKVMCKKKFPLNDNGKIDRKKLHEEYIKSI